MDSFEFRGRTYRSGEIAELNKIADNKTEYADFIASSKDDQDKQRKIDLIEEFKYQRGDDLKRFSPQAVLGAADTIGFGYGLEGISAGLAAVDALTGKSSYKDAYNKYLDFAEGERDRFADKYSGQAMLGDIGGGLLTGGTLLRGLKYLNPFKPTKIPGKVLNLGAEGALVGGLYGSGYSSENRLDNARGGAAIGAAANPITVGGAQAIARVAEPLVEKGGRGIEKLQNVFRSDKNQAPILDDTKVRQAVKRQVDNAGGVDVVRDNLQQDFPIAGDPNVVSSVRPNLQQIDDVWNNFKGEVLNNKTTAISDAYDDVLNRLGNQQDIPKQDGELFVNYLERVGKTNFKNASKAYDDSAINEVVGDDFLTEFDSFLKQDIFSELSDSALRSIKSITAKNKNGDVKKVFSISEDGSIVLNDGFEQSNLNALTVEKLYRSLRNANYNSRSLGGDPTDGEIISGNNLVSNLDGIIQKYTKGLDNVRSKYRNAAAVNEATESGSKLWKTTDAEPFLAELRRLKALDNKNEYNGFLRGAMSTISTKLKGNSKTSFLRRIASDDTPEGEMFRELFPEDQIDDVINNLERTNKFIGAAQNTIKYQSADSINKGNRSLIDNLKKSGKIDALIEEFAPEDLSEKQLQRYSEILLDRAPSNIIDNLDKPGYPELFDNWLRRNIPIITTIPLTEVN